MGVVHSCNVPTAKEEDDFSSVLCKEWFLEYDEVKAVVSHKRKKKKNSKSKKTKEDCKIYAPVIRGVSVDTFGEPLFVVQEYPGIRETMDENESKHYDRCIVVERPIPHWGSNFCNIHNFATKDDEDCNDDEIAGNGDEGDTSDGDDGDEVNIIDGERNDVDEEGGGDEEDTSDGDEGDDGDEEDSQEDVQVPPTHSTNDGGRRTSTNDNVPMGMGPWVPWGKGHHGPAKTGSVLKSQFDAGLGNTP